MDDHDLKAHLKQVFGDSSESDAEEQRSPSNDQLCLNESPFTIDRYPTWEPIEEVNGLWLCGVFLSPPQQSILLSAIQDEGWFTESSNNQGICAHVDLLRFEDGIAILSLESSCVMHFTKVVDETGDESTISRVPVYLNPGSLVIMCGDSRYLWKHEINRKPGFQIWENEELNQMRRTSITLRKLCNVEE